MSPEPLRLHESSHHLGRKDQLADELAGERFIDRAQFQELLRISQSTFERLKARGALPPYIALSRTCHRWPLAAVLAWIRDGCPAPAQRQRYR
jgi:predicted DNA-binding transcriptional regulator AlpA